MKVKAEKTFYHKSRAIRKGDIFEVDSTEGKKLVQYNLVKEEKQSRKTKEQKNVSSSK